MGRVSVLLALLLALSGCGVAETGTAAAAGAASAAQQAQEAKRTEDSVTRQVDAAYKEAADQRRDAERQGQ
jgi:uncharacterized protein YceK